MLLLQPYGGTLILSSHRYTRILTKLYIIHNNNYVMIFLSPDPTPQRIRRRGSGTHWVISGVCSEYGHQSDSPTTADSQLCMRAPDIMLPCQTLTTHYDNHTDLLQTTRCMCIPDPFLLWGYNIILLLLCHYSHGNCYSSTAIYFALDLS